MTILMTEGDRSASPAATKHRGVPSRAALLAVALLLASCAAPHPAAAAPATAAAAPDAIEGPGVLFLGHAVVMVQHGATKVLVDAFYYDWPHMFDVVPTEMKRKLFTAALPFDDIAAVVVTHAHGDHFSGRDLLQFLARQPRARAYVPQQCYDRLVTERGATPELLARVTAIRLAVGDPPTTLTDRDLVIEAVRVPHIDIGRPNEVMENLAFRITLAGETTVTHLGDAAPSRAAYDAQRTFWNARRSDVVLPPYWFFTEGDVDIARDLNGAAAVALHVWPEFPKALVGKRVALFRTAGTRCAILAEPRCGTP
ncbi:MAG: MBL fold metallo-hydrolase [bacterium]